MPSFSLYTPQEVAQTLAKRARAARLTRGFKQSTLATRAGVSLGSLRRFETTGQVSLQNLLKLAFALDRLDDFVELLQPPPARSIDELAALDNAPTRQRGRS